MLSKKSLFVLLLILFTLIVAACSPPSPGGPPGSEQGQAGQPPEGSSPTEEQGQADQSSEGSSPAEEQGQAEQPEQDEQVSEELSSPAGEQNQAGPPPDLAVAAEMLGITEQELMAALGPPPPDLAAAAQTLGITEQELQNALFPAGGPDKIQAGEPAGDAGAPETAATAAPVAQPPAQPPASSGQAAAGSYPLIDTGQTACYSDQQAISCPQTGAAYYGQDAQYAGNQPSYRDNGDGTVTDLNTGLMWIRDPGRKTYYAEAIQKLETYTFAGYDDWRLPTIKELYSLALFSGVDASVANSSNVDGLVPFIDTDYFVFLYGDQSGGNRVIDAQWLTGTVYNSTVMNGQSCFFGFNFSDGRIKCYPLESRTGAGGYFAMFVRGGDDYGVNNYIANGNGTITDQTTGLTWTQNDNGAGVLWNEALNYCNSLSLGGMDDWRLPNIKELHSLVDYTRSPDTTGSAAIDPIFTVPSITNEAGQLDYPFYWSSTTLVSYPDHVQSATYISFGRALGYMEEYGGWIDVHGAGAQRSDPKSGDPASYPQGHGPQGDAIRIYNYARCVRSGAQFVEGAGSGADTSAQPPANNQSSGADTSVQPPAGGSPPQEAINACSGLSANVACQFTTPHGEVSGTCTAIAEQLTCVPEGGPPSQ